MRKAYLYSVVSVSGASVLAIEILGTRVLGPFYGVSIFLWSALISVTLAALSAGYTLGGRWADRAASYRRLASLLFIAGLWMLVLPFLKRPVINLAEPLGLRAAVLFATVILFAPPLTLLGMVSPHAIKLRTQSLDEVGRSAGDLYALSTVASVVAALLTGFFLIPTVGVNNLLLIIGVLLVGTALVSLFDNKKSAAAATIVFLALTLGSAFTSRVTDVDVDPERGLIAYEESAYAELRVVEVLGLRYLLIDGGVHTIVDPETFDTKFPYANVVDLARRFFDEPGRMLLVGLGGGSVAKRYSAEGWNVDAVEIDPGVTALAREHFGLEPHEARVFHTDGRQFMRESDDHYEVIVMDAFGSSAIPFHLVTTEAFADVKARLTGDGILVMNLESVGWRDTIVRSITATLLTRFETVYALPTVEPPNRIGNVLIFASDTPIELGYELPPPSDRDSDHYDRVHAWDNRFEPDPTGAPVLTDDRSPVDLWAESINLVARRNLHEFFSENQLSW